LEIPQFPQKGNTSLRNSCANVPPHNLHNAYCRENPGQVVFLALPPPYYAPRAIRYVPATREARMPEKVRKNQKTKAGAKLKPGKTGAFASNNSLPLHLPFTGSNSFAFPSGPEVTTATSRPASDS
jgi:hypothetical protein